MRLVSDFQSVSPATRGRRTRRPWAGSGSGVILAVALAVVGAGCTTTARDASCLRSDQCHRCRERVTPDVLSSLGGKFVSVLAILKNPEHGSAHVRVEPEGAQEVSAAQLVVQNGGGVRRLDEEIESESSVRRPLLWRIRCQRASRNASSVSGAL